MYPLRAHDRSTPPLATDEDRGAPVPGVGVRGFGLPDAALEVGTAGLLSSPESRQGRVTLRVLGVTLHIDVVIDIDSYGRKQS